MASNVCVEWMYVMSKFELVFCWLCLPADGIVILSSHIDRRSKVQFSISVVDVVGQTQL